MSIDSMSQIIENIQSVYTIVLALAIAEAFNQTVRTKEPEDESHSTTIPRWFECVHPSRLLSLIVFLLLAIPFFQGNHKYLYLQYIAPLQGPHPPKSISAKWLNFDCLIFTAEAGMFFVMSRSLSARRWQQFYATIVFLLLLDFVWALMEKWHKAALPTEWLWFDIIAAAILSGIIFIDWLFPPRDKDKEINTYCYLAVTFISILGLAYGYLYQIDYLIDH